MSKNNAVYVQTFSKGLQIIEFLAEKQTITVTALAKHMGLQKSASYRFLNTLRLHGYLEQDTANNYVLTDRLQKLGNGIVPKLEFYSIATRILNELTKNYANYDTVANLGFWNGSEITYLAQSTHNTYMQFHEGSTVPAYCSGLGKAILAYFSEEEIDQYIQTTKFQKFTEQTISSGKAFKEELAQVREQGFAVMDNELCLGLKGIAIPLVQENDPVRYAVSLTQTRYGDIKPLIETFHPLLDKVADEVLQYLDLGIYSTIR